MFELWVFEVRVIAERAATRCKRTQCEHTVKREYSFSRGERGKFACHAAAVQLPIYLDKKVEAYLTERASSKGVAMGDLVNEMLKRDIALVESVR